MGSSQSSEDQYFAIFEDSCSSINSSPCNSEADTMNKKIMCKRMADYRKAKVDFDNSVVGKGQEMAYNNWLCKWRLFRFQLFAFIGTYYPILQGDIVGQLFNFVDEQQNLLMSNSNLLKINTPHHTIYNMNVSNGKALDNGNQDLGVIQNNMVNIESVTNPHHLSVILHQSPSCDYKYTPCGIVNVKPVEDLISLIEESIPEKAEAEEEKPSTSCSRVVY